jgi:hypothetical protein
MAVANAIAAPSARLARDHQRATLSHAREPEQVRRDGANIRSPLRFRTSTVRIPFSPRLTHRQHSRLLRIGRVFASASSTDAAVRPASAPRRASAPCWPWSRYARKPRTSRRLLSPSGRADDSYGDEGVASASTSGPLLGHERAGRPLDRPDDRYRGMGGARTTAAAKPTSSAFAGPSSADVRPNAARRSAIDPAARPRSARDLELT